ncbi:hypothetical protein C8R46DRAFT_1206027 [Mycena filopes]|nr:hypothetical protein C8R46DRAFT_1206027 [Mycena filopes]
MNTFTFATLLALVSMDDPTATTSVTATLDGVPRPTSTDPALLAAYDRAAESCGPALVAELQALLPTYLEEVNDPRPNISATDPAVQQWAQTEPAMETKQLQCTSDTRTFGSIAYSDSNSTSTDSLTPTSSNSPASGPTGLTVNPASDTPLGTSASDKPTSTMSMPLHGGAIGGCGFHPALTLTSVVVLLACLFQIGRTLLPEICKVYVIPDIQCLIVIALPELFNLLIL